MKMLYIFMVAALCIAVPSSAVVANNCDHKRQIEVLALNMYHEARGDGKTFAERVDAMQMVGEVTLNRVASDNYPNTVCDVVYQKRQFHWTSLNKKDPKDIQSWKIATSIAEGLIDGSIDKFNNGATHFINPSKVRRMPTWTKKFNVVGKVGQHVFYTDDSVEPEILPERPL